MQNYSEGEGLQHHLRIGKDDVGRYMIMPGDPKHCEKVVRHSDNARLVVSSGECIIYTGCPDGEKVSVTSVGIGGPSASIVLGKLVLCGADTFIRMETCGGMEMNVKGGDIVVVMGAIRMGETNKEYVPIEYPVMVDLNVTNVLVSAAKVLEYIYHVEVVECKDIFYGQHEPEGVPVSYELLNKWEAWRRMGCEASRMGLAALFIVANHLRMHCGSDFLVVGNRKRQNVGLDSPIVHDTEAATRVAVEAIRRLIKKDRS